jgi:hypothetical protein
LSDLSEPGTAPRAPSTNSSAAYRGALAAVIFLGVLIVIALGVLVAGLAMRFGGRKAAPPAFAQYTLAPGNRLISTDLSGDRLVLRLRGPDGDEIDIIDIESGRLIAKIHSSVPPQK